MTKIKQTWRLPKPKDLGDSYEWLPVVRVGRIVPWGYEQDPNDPDILLPIPEQLEMFEKAKKFLKQYSSREVAAWLSEETGRSISHVALLDRVKLEARRKTQIGDANFWAARYKEAMEKAKKLEARELGRKRNKEDDSSDS